MGPVDIVLGMMLTDNPVVQDRYRVCVNEECWHYSSFEPPYVVQESEHFLRVHTPGFFLGHEKQHCSFTQTCCRHDTNINVCLLDEGGFTVEWDQ